MSSSAAEAAELPTAPQEMTNGQIIDELGKIRDERRKISKLDSELNEAYRAFEAELISRLDEQGMDKASTVDLTATLSVDEVPNVVDWDSFYDYVVDTDSLHLLQRRVATAAWRELRNAGLDIPGVDPYFKRSISLRKR